MILVVKDKEHYYMATNAYFSGVDRSLDVNDAIDEDNINIFFNPNSKALIGSGWSNIHFDILKYHPEIFTMDINPLNLKFAVDKINEIEKDFGLSFENDEDAPNLVFIQGENAFQISKDKIVIGVNDVDIISNGYENCVELKVLCQSNNNPNPIERIKESMVKYCEYRKVRAFPIVVYDSINGNRILIKQ